MGKDVFFETPSPDRKRPAGFFLLVYTVQHLASFSFFFQSLFTFSSTILLLSLLLSCHKDLVPLPSSFLFLFFRERWRRRNTVTVRRKRFLHPFPRSARSSVFSFFLHYVHQKSFFSFFFKICLPHAAHCMPLHLVPSHPGRPDQLHLLLFLLLSTFVGAAVRGALLPPPTPPPAAPLGPAAAGAAAVAAAAAPHAGSAGLVVGRAAVALPPTLFPLSHSPVGS